MLRQSILLMTLLIMQLRPPLFAQGLFDDFNGSNINTDNWNILNTKWGENALKGTHGGVVQGSGG